MMIWAQDWTERCPAYSALIMDAGVRQLWAAPAFELSKLDIPRPVARSRGVCVGDLLDPWI
jgi:hypothetical protein